jgi:hypothetical protein
MSVHVRLIAVIGAVALAGALPLVAQQAPAPAPAPAQPQQGVFTPTAGGPNAPPSTVVYEPDRLAGEKNFEVGVQPPFLWKPIPEPLPKVPAGFTPIFNGRNLEGWHASHTNIHGTMPNFQVIDGAIVGMQIPLGEGGILLTDKSYHNFEFYMEVRPDYGCDSGVFFRSTEAGHAYQVTMDYLPGGSMGSLILEGIANPNRGQGAARQGGAAAGRAGAAGAAGAAGRGRGTPVVGGIPLGATTPNGDAAWMKAWKREAWNTVRIRSEGDVPHVQVWINDQLVTDRQETENRAEGGITSGMIAIQMHGGNRWVQAGVWRWRNIGIRELP